MRGVGGGERVGGGLAVLLGGRHLAHQRLALLLDHGGQGGELGDLRLGLGGPFLERGDLLVGAGGPRLPALTLEPDGRLPLGAGAMLALERDELGAALGDARAQVGSRRLRRRQVRLQGFHAAERR